MDVRTARWITAIEIASEQFAYYRAARRLVRDILLKIRRAAKEGEVSIRVDFHRMYFDYVIAALEEKGFDTTEDRYRINDLCFITVKWGRRANK